MDYSSLSNANFDNYIDNYRNEQDKILNEEIEDLKETKKRRNITAVIKDKRIFPALIFVYYFVLAMHLGLYAFQYIHGIYFIDTSFFSYSTVSVLLWGVAPVLVFLFSTNYTFWNYHLQKKIILWLSAISMVLEMTKYVYLLSFSIFVPLIIKMPLVKGITTSMILYLIRLTLIIFPFSFVMWLLLTTYHLFTNRYVTEDINSFRLKNYISKTSFSAFDKYSYKVSCIWRMSNGLRYTVSEKDRFLHTLVDGSTGSGKTTSTLVPIIVDDLDTKVRNEDKLKQSAFKGVKSGKLKMVKSFSDEDFNIDNFEALDGYTNVLDKLKKTYRSCGMTILAPDASLTDQVYDYCKKRDIKCNRIDPEFDITTNQPKEGCVGFNPLYLSPSITPSHPQYNTLIVQKAILFSDVIQAIAEMGGKSEQYFASINRNIVTTFVILLKLTYPKLHNGKQPTPEHVQQLVNDFSRVTPYYNELKRNRELCHTFRFVIDFIANDILGEGRKDMNNQARGLRIMLNELLANPKVRNILCADNSIDQDLMLSEGQITVVNYGLEMGDKDAAALGLFFALSFNNACLRRPGTEDTRIPHFYVVDEFPVLLHPQFEKCFTLFRKYRVACCFALQTLEQMNKNDTTRYLAGVIRSNAGHQILYGGMDITEMKLYQELSGTKAVATEQTSISQTSITSDEPSLSYSTRSSIQEENELSGGEMRYRGFQEVTVFGKKDGSPLKPFHAKLSFVPKSKQKKVERYHVDWESVYEDFFNDKNIDDTTLLFQTNSLLEDTGSITVMNKVPEKENKTEVDMTLVDNEKLITFDEED